MLEGPEWFFKGRSGLKQLLQDVVTGNCTYKTVLVYDVSRWGRFQDCDEAAHYEFLCRQAGVSIRYCTESFADDSTIAGSVMKALKRTMAAEYSRELGIKSEQAKTGSIRLDTSSEAPLDTDCGAAQPPVRGDA